MPVRRLMTSLALLLTAAGAARAQSVTLVEDPLPGKSFKLDLSMELKGKIKIQQGGETKEYPHEATARHALHERVMDATGPVVDKTARHYARAEGEIAFNKQATRRTLRAERAFMVAHRAKDRLVVYSTKGALTHEEMELTEHFDTLAIPAILPGKDVSVGEGWKLSTAVALALCDLDGLTEHDLACKLESLKDGVATISVVGSATGIDMGAQVKLLVNGRARFDTAVKRITAVEWKQSDERQQGPVSPALSADVSIKLTRTPVETPNELSDFALVPVPADKAPPAGLVALQHRDPRGRFEFQHGRDWHVVSPDDSPQLVLRLMDRGDFIAQATLTPWKKADPKAVMSPDDFHKLMSETPGWEEDQVLEKPATIESAPGYTVHRYTASGEMEKVKAVQSFHLVAGPNGEQLIVTFSVVPTQLQKMEARDLELVRAITFPGAVIQTKSEQ